MNLPPDFEECGECGFDHEYEYAEAYRAHSKGESVMERQLVLVVLFNGDAVCAYPMGPEDAKQISTIRSKVQERVRAEIYAPRGEPVKVQCQIVEVDMPTCSPDGFIASLVNDIMDKVST